MNLQHPLSNRIGRRIAVIGTTGSGKTRLATQLAELLGAPHIELDALHWGPNWSSAPPEIFRERLIPYVSGRTWVTDGNYREARDLIWARADTVVWLDYPLPVILWRLFWRTLHRVTSQEELWNGNRESFRGAFFSRDSLFIWALTTYRRRKKEYSVLLARPECQHLAVIHLTSPRQTQRWLSTITASTRAKTSTQ